MTPRDTEFKAHFNLRNRVFGRLTVGEQAGVNKHRTRLWVCRCVCGVRLVVDSSSLRTGHTKSCGCLQIETAKRTFFRHGYSRGTPTYSSWQAMIQRCTNPKNPRWKDYGGRGITVCRRWRKFENFLGDMKTRPLGKSLDRINPNANYSLKNVRWATAKEQANNRRNHDK